MKSKENKPSEPKAIIPYTLIRSLAQCDNIYELRLFGWIIAKAMSVLKLYQRDLRDINLEHAIDCARITIPARFLLQPGATNQQPITKAFGLAKKTVHYEKDGIVAELNIIANPKLYKANGQLMLTTIIDNILWHALLEFSKGYRIINLPAFMRLSSPYAVVMYILITQQSAPIKLGYDYLRRTLGATSKAYDRSNNFERKVLAMARKQLDEHAPYSFDYEPQREGRGGKPAAYIIRPRKCDYKPDKDTKSEEIERDTRLAQMRCRLPDEVADYLRYNFNATERDCEAVERYFCGRTIDWSIDKLAKVKEAALRKGDTRNMMAYLTASLKNLKPII